MASQDCLSLPVLAVLILVLIFLLGQPLATTKHTPSISLIAGTYSRTKYSQGCMSTLEADQRIFATDLSGLCKIAIELSAAKASDILSSFTELVSNATDYTLWANLSLCRELYNQNTSKIAKKGLLAFDRGDYKAASQMVGLVNQAAEDCSKIGITLLSQSNMIVFRLTADTMAMLNFLF